MICTKCLLNKPPKQFGWTTKYHLVRRNECNSCAMIRQRKRQAIWKEWWRTHDPYALHPIGKQRCRRCQKVKRVQRFAYNRCTRSGLQNTCKSCHLEMWQIRNYGRMVKRDEECEICGTNQHLCIDHCHETITLRGTLCVQCNSMLGMAQDNEDILLAGVEYLNKYRKLQSNLEGLAR